MTKARKFLIVTAIAVPSCATVFFFVLPQQVQERYNPVFSHPPYQVSERARELHQGLLIADLHADSLLWDTDLAKKNSIGHVDVPRLIEGNTALQVFTIVTKVPFQLNIEKNSDTTDMITSLAIAEWWPLASWTSLKERVLYQTRKLKEVVARSGRRFVIIQTAADLSDYLERRRRDPAITSGLLGIEGAHALQGDLANIDLFFANGVRLMSPTHFFDNDIGGSAHGIQKGGLTEKGKEMIRRMQAIGMIVDLAHASPKTIEDTLAISTKPVIVSHTGVKGTCDNNRNLNDTQIRGIARSGGLIGIGYWETAVCGKDARAIARAVRYSADVGGVEHTVLGSDFDGSVAVPFDTSGLAMLTDALIAEGFTDDEIHKIMGGNALEFLLKNLPNGP